MGDMLDSVSINSVINRIQPDEIYNFADQDNVSWSRDIPLYSYSTTTLAVIQIFEFLFGTGTIFSVETKTSTLPYLFLRIRVY